MRFLLPAVLMLSLAACATSTGWQKPGVSAATRQQDLGICSRAAAARAKADYPSDVNGPLWPYQEVWAYYDTMNDSERPYDQDRLTSACMRWKGYQQAPASS